MSTSQNSMEEKQKIFFENVRGLLLNCIEHRDLRLIVDVLQDLARRWDIYLKLRTPDIVVVKLRDIPYDNGLEVVVVNRYGLEITVRIFKLENYVSEIDVSYYLVNSGC